MSEEDQEKVVSPDSHEETKSMNEQALISNENSTREFKPIRLESFDDYQYINLQWKNYLQTLPLPMIQSGIVFPKIEYVGAFVHILGSRNPTLRGMQGIITQESMHNFNIISRNDRKYKVEKKSLVFELLGMDSLFQRRMIIHGTRLIFRPIERTTKRFKP